MSYHIIDTFAVCKDEWNTEEGIGKSMKNALYVLSCTVVCTSRTEATLNSEKIKPIL